jgi:uncharacterized protein (DUF1810 family)
VSFDLERFVDAQATTYAQALAELRDGRKRTHWMWFIFPQLAGLGRSEVSRLYSIASLDEARAYLAHRTLGPRLRAGAQALLDSGATDPEAALGPIDAVKLRSSMTLFGRAAPDEPVFREVLDRLYGGRFDEGTDRLLDSAAAGGQLARDGGPDLPAR